MRAAAQREVLIATAAPRLLRQLHGGFAAPHAKLARAHVQLMREAHGKPAGVAVEDARVAPGREAALVGFGDHALHGVIDGGDDGALDAVALIAARARPPWSPDPIDRRGRAPARSDMNERDPASVPLRRAASRHAQPCAPAPLICESFERCAFSSTMVMPLASPRALSAVSCSNVAPGTSDSTSARCATGNEEQHLACRAESHPPTAAAARPPRASARPASDASFRGSPRSASAVALGRHVIVLRDQDRALSRYRQARRARRAAWRSQPCRPRGPNGHVDLAPPRRCASAPARSPQRMLRTHSRPSTLSSAERNSSSRIFRRGSVRPARVRLIVPGTTRVDSATSVRMLPRRRQRHANRISSSDHLAAGCGLHGASALASSDRSPCRRSEIFRA